MSLSCGPWLVASRAGAAAAPPTVPTGCVFWTFAAGGAGSGSRMSAPSPRPKAFLGIGNYLLSELCIPLSPFTMYVIENDRLTKTWRFGQTDIAGNYALKNLCTEKTAQISGNLARKRGPFVVHRKQNAFYLERGIECSPNPHESVEQFGNSFKRQVFALNRNQDCVCADQAI